jgi:hypothetical protein
LKRDQFTWPSGAAGDLLIFSRYLWSGDRSFLIAAASPSVSKVPEDWEINVKKLTRRAPATTAAEERVAAACDDAVSLSILFFFPQLLYPF